MYYLVLILKKLEFLTALMSCTRHVITETWSCMCRQTLISDWLCLSSRPAVNLAQPAPLPQPSNRQLLRAHPPQGAARPSQVSAALMRAQTHRISRQIRARHRY